MIDTAALIQTLQQGNIYAAGLDVTDLEPLPRDHPLLNLDNVTIAQHLGSATEQTRQRVSEISVENLWAGLEGKNCYIGSFRLLSKISYDCGTVAAFPS